MVGGVGEKIIRREVSQALITHYLTYWYLYPRYLPSISVDKLFLLLSRANPYIYLSFMLAIISSYSRIIGFSFLLVIFININML